MTREDFIQNLEGLTDETLFARFRGGDTKAFEALLVRYKRPLFSLILKSVYAHEEAEEVFQDTFFKMIERKDQFRDAVSFKAWIFTICRNTCIDRARKRQRRPINEPLFRDEERPGEEIIASENLSPVEQFEEAQLSEQMEKVLAKLPEEQRETFLLKVKSGLTFEEIGDVMKCSVNTAKSRMRYALEELRTLLKKRGVLLPSN